MKNDERTVARARARPCLSSASPLSSSSFLNLARRAPIPLLLQRIQQARLHRGRGGWGQGRPEGGIVAGEDLRGSVDCEWVALFLMGRAGRAAHRLHLTSTTLMGR